MAGELEILDYDIKQCPLCTHTHVYKLKVFKKKTDENKVVLFGGAGDQTEVMFQCPENNRRFTFAVPSADFEVLGIATAEDIEKYKTGKASPLPQVTSGEMTDWVKNSRTIALDFCKNMLSTAIGAIAVYFAILKYLGSEKISKPGEGYLLLPAVLFLISAVAYVLALKPRFDSIEEKDFEQFKKKRLTQLNNYLVGGTVLFIVGIGCAIIIFLRLL